VAIVSGSGGKRPASKEEFVQLLKDAMMKEAEKRKVAGAARRNPTIAGTASIMGIHRDTLYEWLRDFNVKFEEVGENVMSSSQYVESVGKPVYLIGEALVGEGDEVAHIDLLIGDKSGPVGEAFASGLSNLSAGHTPLLAVIRPNLPPKPHTLLVPKVTVKNMEDVAKVFGPAQAAVAKAIADAAEEGVIPRDKLDEWVVISSVFLHPNAKDFRRIYHYNYSATKLALKRALSRYPSFDKVIYDKDRAKHPIMGFRVPRLWRPPYLQIALDIPSIERTKSIIGCLPESDRIILEVGTPLLKKYGVKVIRDLREVAKDYFVIADLKTLDVGKVEVDLAFEETADAVVAAGLAAPETIDEFLHEAQRLGIYGVIDMMNVEDSIAKLKSLKNFPDIVLLHRPIDVEKSGKQHGWTMIKDIKQMFRDRKFLVAVAGGINPLDVREALRLGADIIIVGRYITQSRDVERATRDFLESTIEMREDIDLYRVHVE
jgi:bifunctional enzyme Fae/Hps